MNKQLEIKLTTRFKKQLKTVSKRPNFDYNSLDTVINILASNELLPEKYNNHLLIPKSKRYMGMPCTTGYIARI